jgi:hypothetical protein
MMEHSQAAIEKRAKALAQRDGLLWEEEHEFKRREYLARARAEFARRGEDA